MERNGVAIQKRTQVIVAVRSHLVSGTGLGDSHRDTQDGVSSELSLVSGSVELDEQVIDLLLLGDVKTALDEGLGDDVVDVGNGLGDTLTHVGVLVSITELNGLVHTGRGTGRNLSCDLSILRLVEL
jgi:hypothetical protein